MHIRRMTSLLQGVADVRNWIVQHIPMTTSMVGYDFFLLLGNEYFNDRAVRLSDAYRLLPHTPGRVRAVVLRMEKAGIIGRQGEGDDAIVIPTAQGAQLLDAYRRKFESLFILRKGLREQQLLVNVSDPTLRHFAESLYDHFYDIGWLYLHNFGSVCFLMSTLVQRVAEAYGHRARIVSGYVDFATPNGHFVIGGRDTAMPGQVNGHGYVVVDEKIIIDFGLGTLRKHWRRDFYWAIATDYQPQDDVDAVLVLPNGDRATWKHDWVSPHTEPELTKYAGYAPGLLQQYEELFR